MNPSPTVSSRPAESDEGLRVLLLEDDPSVRKAARLFLEQAGHTVYDADEPESAVELAESVSPHVLLSDCKLRVGHDGIEAARTIQSRTGARVILVTGYTEADLEPQLHGLDVSAYMLKPISYAELADVVHKVAAPD
ncbi:MAG: response regulator [Xanthomonadales bacterium]|nr:response regulator [Xanthomonadales bacterium]